MKKILFYIFCLSLAGSLSLSGQSKLTLTNRVLRSTIPGWTQAESNKAFDSDATSALNIVSTTTVYFVLDLGAEYFIDWISFTFGNTQYSMNIYSSLDDVTYTTSICATSSTGSGSFKSFSFPNNKNRCRYLKVEFGPYYGSVSATLKNFEIYARTFSSYSYSYWAAGGLKERTILLGGGKSAYEEQGDTTFKDAISEDEVFTDNLKEHEIVLYPVPTEGLLNVRINNLGSGEEASIHVFDIKGNQVMIMENFQNGIVDLSDKSDGMYILQIRIDDEQTEWKILKE
jgi:hypothetical protein